MGRDVHTENKEAVMILIKPPFYVVVRAWGCARARVRVRARVRGRVRVRVRVRACARAWASVPLVLWVFFPGVGARGCGGGVGGIKSRLDF